ncbi:T-cell surface glycoprotein CD1c-like [Hyperolius riggenbachi]|uniref:T-cell surface glycoprotein CD1c-like n=1 Tax=Hyperolius riggenbachi TaxID=752182 RepID=UPI0035A26F22
MQCMAGCSSDPETTGPMFYRVAFNGFNLVHIDVDRGVWISPPYASQIEDSLNSDPNSTNSILYFVKDSCKFMAGQLLLAGREALQRKIQPEVSFFWHHKESEDELICMATGFYPEPINVSLWRGETHRIEGAVSTGILPNGDGTFQIVTFLDLTREDGSDLYCRVEHSSLKEPLIIQIEETHKTLIGVILGVMLGLCLLVLGVAWLIARRKSNRYRSILGANGTGIP